MSESSIMLPELAAWLLLVVLAIVLLLGFTFVAIVLHLSRKRRLEGAPLVRPSESSFPLPRDAFHLSFPEWPARWLAIRSTKQSAVQTALGITNPTPCPLGDGLGAANELNLFISPPIRGWILVTGNDLPDPVDDVDRCFVWLKHLSQRLGEVQFFSANRALNHHAWVRLLTGEVFRAYAWADETLWNQGALTRAELDLKLTCLPYGSHDDARTTPPAGVEHNAEKVPQLAARWSLDPATIDRHRHWPKPGIAGELNLL